MGFKSNWSLIFERPNRRERERGEEKREEEKEEEKKKMNGRSSSKAKLRYENSKVLHIR